MMQLLEGKEVIIQMDLREPLKARARMLNENESDLQTRVSLFP